MLYSTWEPEDNILDPRLVLAFEEKEERDRAQAHRRKGLRPRRLILRNIYTMELRSAHKAPEKPAPRIRLSLTRSVGAELEHSGRRCRIGEGRVKHQRLEKRKSRQCVSRHTADNTENPRQRTLTHKKDSTEEEWEEEKEQEKKKRKTEKDDEKTDEHRDIPSAQEKTEDSTFSAEQNVTAMANQTEHHSSTHDYGEDSAKDSSDGTCSAPTVTDKSASDTITDTHEQGPITDGSEIRVSALELHDHTTTHQSTKTSSEAVLTAKEGSAIDRGQNRVSVIAVRHLIDSCGRGQAKETAETECSTAKLKEETGEDEGTAEYMTTLQLSTEVRTNQSQASESSQHPGKVIVTEVTINSLTVTFKEAVSAEGFFSGCELQV
ncbi:hypothetical protein P4O66_019032 [Electrophorus voltai]|uniref:Chromobox homolog 7a n=1 Tax=Electrophorus voltai TaxID=2609070 RepID=A0AAD8YRX7_9TELE|nr:hypothetical protein P4O66_019032 [Electrophorus voltai]